MAKAKTKRKRKPRYMIGDTIGDHCVWGAEGYSVARSLTKLQAIHRIKTTRAKNLILYELVEQTITEENN